MHSVRRDPVAFLPRIRQLAESLRSRSPQELLAEANDVRLKLRRGAGIESENTLTAAIALVSEALRRSLGIQLYDVQLQAVLSLTSGIIIQMQTGEGKTFVAATVACCLALAGQGVHVMTPNSYLAKRDHETAQAIAGLLGMSAGLLPEGSDDDGKRAAYNCDVTYGTGHEFGFDYLRDQLTLREHAGARLGSTLLQRLQETGPQPRLTLQRGLVSAVVDEADSVLLDDAGSPLVLSVASPGSAPDERAHVTALALLDVLQEDTDFVFDRDRNHVHLTPDGMNRCYADDVAIPLNCLLRPWTDYVEQALRARFTIFRDVHYVVVEGEVRIVDESTGRIFEDRSWQQGLHQAVEAREGLPVSPDEASLARITRQRYFRLYRHLCGMSGTTIGCEQEFRNVYGRAIAEIPLRVPSARHILPHRWFVAENVKYRAILSSVAEVHAIHRPVLVGTRSIESSLRLAELFSECGLAFELLNGLQSAEEAEIIARAGEADAITIATNLAGRGTDIHISDDVCNAGGLHVVVAECQLSGRMDRQLIGRCGRQGNPGSAQAFVAADDLLLRQYGAWLGTAIRREANADGESCANYLPQLLRIQAAAEQHQYLGRRDLLRQDMSQDSLFGL